MRRIILAFTLIGLLGSGAAVVGGPNASDGEMAITSGGSSSATTAVGPNSTRWSTNIENRNSSCRSSNTSQSIDFIGFQGDGELTELNFEGVINTSNPCVKLSLDSEKVEEDVYQVEIVESPAEGPCTSCLGAAEFAASFSAPGDYKVEIINENETLGVQKTPGFQEENSSETGSEEAGVGEGLSSILRWLSSLF